MSLSHTISRLQQGRESFASAYAGSSPRHGAPTRLVPLEGFDNPGNLRGLCHVPAGTRGPTPLLVVLHGCTQDAAGYDRGAGWSLLADRLGFALLYPEQKRENNHNLCFNWYQRGDATRGGGEAASIAGMIAAMAAQQPIDRARVFVTGLSAGGAMTSVMLASYPELFAGGAIIAGLPFGCADNLAQAFDCMGGRGFGDPATLADRVRRESGHAGPWPRVSIWQGSADYIVAPANADALARQWTGVHGLAAAPDRVETLDGHPRRVWIGADGREAVEVWTVQGMAHGIPLMPGSEDGESGQAGAHMLDVGLSSTDRIAAFFGIGPVVTAQNVRAAGSTAPHDAAPIRRANSTTTDTPITQAPVFGGVQKTIEDALRGAGLMK